MPTASMAGASSDRLPVISPTINITAKGAWAIPPKRAIIPTITNGAAVAGMPGRKPTVSRQKLAPSSPPMTIPGPKMPPLPPEPIDSDVARIFANGITSTTHSGSPSSRWSMPTCTQP